jgi:RNA 3'-terminal phosphate cyclase (ATP)
MLTIDGSAGEGGGQILRTSLALSVLTKTPITIERIRAGRPKPGLMRQHLTAVLAAQKLCGAKLTGGEVGSQRIVFEPGELVTGDLEFQIGTAGSTALVLQTVLPPLMVADAPTTVTVSGGTHNPKAPTVEFLNEAFLPLLGKIGPKVALTMERAGFYPAGGGRIVAHITPTPREQLSRLVLHERGEATDRGAWAAVSNLPNHIARREIGVIGEQMGWAESMLHSHVWTSPGPGNVVWMLLGYDNVREVFTGIGEKGKSSEQVAADVIAEARAYLASGAPVGEHLADQLLLPMALAGGGSFCCTPPSLHTRTQAEIIEKFLEVEFTFERQDGRRWRIDVEA